MGIDGGLLLGYVWFWGPVLLFPDLPLLMCWGSTLGAKSQML